MDTLLDAWNRTVSAVGDDPLAAVAECGDGSGEFLLLDLELQIRPGARPELDALARQLLSAGIRVHARERPVEDFSPDADCWFASWFCLSAVLPVLAALLLLDGPFSGGNSLESFVRDRLAEREAERDAAVAHRPAFCGARAILRYMAAVRCDGSIRSTSSH